MINKLEVRIEKIESFLEEITKTDFKKYDEHQHQCRECGDTIDISIIYDEPRLSHQEILVKSDEITKLLIDLKSDIDRLKMGL